MTLAAGMSARPGISLAVAGLVTVALVVLMVLVQRPETTGDLFAPIDPATVVAELHTGSAAYPEALRVLLRDARAAPEDPGAAKAAARALIDQGRAAGDGRLVGASLGLLRPFLDTGDSEVLVLDATARQYQHDFVGALATLDKALSLDARDVNALLIRATINTVLGKFNKAVQDCRTISALPRIDVGFVCQATALTLTAQAPAALQRLRVFVAQPGMISDALVPYAIGLIGEISVLQGDDAGARADFERALALAPGDVRLRLVYAELLLRANQPAQVLTLLQDAAPVDGVEILRYVAATQLGQGQVAGAARTEIAQRVTQNLALGLTAHAREEAQYFMRVAPDPAMALTRAQINWGLQHEIIDAQLLIDAAEGAGQPVAAKPVLDWIAAERVVVPVLRIPADMRKTGP